MFSIKRFWSIFRARNKEFYRDLGALGWTFIFPFLMVIGFGYVFNIGQDQQFKIAYFGEQKVEIEFVQWVKSENKEETLNKFNHHAFDLVIDFQTNPATYWVSDTSPKSKIVEKLFLQADKKVDSSRFQKNSIKGEEIPYVEWLFPGLITMNSTWMCLWGVGWVIVRQRKVGILKRFKSSPLTPFEFLSAQLVSRLLIQIGSGVIVFGGSHLIYPFQTQGSYFTLLLLYCAGCLSLSSIGLLFATRSSSDEMVSGMLNFINFPMIFLSEIFFSLEGSPGWVNWIAKVQPLYHMTDSMRRVMNEGATVLDVKFSLLFMLGTGFVFTLIGSLMFKWTSQN